MPKIQVVVVVSHSGIILLIKYQYCPHDLLNKNTILTLIKPLVLSAIVLLQCYYTPPILPVLPGIENENLLEVRVKKNKMCQQSLLFDL